MLKKTKTKTQVSSTRNPGLTKDPMIVRKQAGQFPGIGVTLSGYRGSAKPLKSPIIKAKKPGVFKRIFSKFSIKRVVLSLIILIIAGGILFSGNVVYDLHKVFGGNIFGFLDPTRLKGEDSGRVTILLAGNSSDDPGHQGALLTDSIMLVSIDTKDNTAWLLSVPRDLWVNIPGYDYQKINAAYEDGAQENFSSPGYFNGGMGLLQQIVSQDLNVPIDYYGLIDYNAVKEAVDAVGGIDINIQSDDPRGLYDPSIDYSTGGPLVDLSNGEHHLDGQQALDLARARGDAYGSYGFDQSDFERTANQRKMLIALKDKVETSGVLSNPFKLTSFFNAIGSNVQSDLTVSDATRLYDLVKKIPSKDIKSLSLNSANGQDLLTSYSAPGGQSAVIPALGVNNYSAIQSYMESITKVGQNNQ